MSSTARHSLLLALSSLSVAALFAWYIRSSRKKRGPRQILDRDDDDDGINTSKNQERSATTFSEQSSHRSEEVSASDNFETSQSGDNSRDREHWCTTPRMTSALEGVPEVTGVNSTLHSNKTDKSAEECEKSITDLHLVLDVSHQVEPQAFSWSDEMEKSYTAELKKKEEQQRNVGNNGSGDYATSDSPGLASQNSEVSSQDSGRATGGLASSLSPMDEAGDVLPMYEFEIPNTLVGLVIGIKGKTIKELSTRTDVRMLIRQHHIPEKVDTHQICQVRGKREQINRCLQMLRRRFPPARFPELNLQPVLPPPLPSHLFDTLACQPSWLTLPDAIPCEVVCSSMVDPGHFFLQQPTHPSFSSLSHLDMYMIRLYSQRSDIPDLPKPCQTGLLCAAPVLGAWFRAVTVSYNMETDEVVLRFVDYGGYTRLPRTELRQIRTDLMTLPFQAIECYLAHVQPVDGTWQWVKEAYTFFQKLCMGKVINATVVGFNITDKVPMVELTVPSEDGKLIRVDKELMNSGFAKASDPSKLQKVSVTKSRSMATHSAPMVAAI